MSQEWRRIVTRYQRSDTLRASLQLVSTLVLLAASMVVMYYSLAVSYLLTLLLAVPAAGLLVRTFVIMHDCAHGSFFTSRRANELVGWFTGVLTLTPFARWKHEHAMHHASSGDLDRRGHGDLTTLTVREYREMSRWKRLQYRLFRNPMVMLGLGPIHVILRERLLTPKVGLLERGNVSVITTNLAVAAIVVALSFAVGFAAIALVYLPAMYLAAAGGIWLFYVQHQFEGTYWREHERWDYETAAIRGSSHFRLNPVLQWFTGSIGLHHVHHLGPRIPNYHLQRAHDENELFHQATELTLLQSLRMLKLKLWCEERGRLVGFNE